MGMPRNVIRLRLCVFQFVSVEVRGLVRDGDIERVTVVCCDSSCELRAQISHTKSRD